MKRIAWLIVILLVGGSAAYGGVESKVDAFTEQLAGGGGAARDEEAASVAFGDEALTEDELPGLTVMLSATHDEVETGVVVTWTAAESSGATAILLEWDLDGDGDFETATDGPTVSRAYDEDGLVVGRVRVTDDRGATGTSDSVVLVVANRVPEARFTVATETGQETALVVLRDASSDLDGTIAEWRWDFGDGSGSRDANPTHAYEDDGSYVVTLVVVDDDGEESAAFARTVVVENSAPVAAFASPAVAIVGASVAFVDESEDPSPNGSIVHVAWDFGDGAYQAGGPATDGVYVHTYADPGTYAVTLYVIDDDGAMSSVRRIVSVT